MGLSRLLAPLAAAAFVVGVASTGIAAGAASPAQAGVSSFASLRIDNFGQINPTYFRGGQPEGRDYADLAALGWARRSESRPIAARKVDHLRA